MTRRSRFPLVVIAVAALAAGCAGSGASGEQGAAAGKAAPKEALSSTASTAPRSKLDTMEPEAFRATMRRAADAEKTDRKQAATVYTEALARTDLTNDQRAIAQMRFGRLRLAEGKIDEARMLGQQALALRPGWNDATALLKQVDERAAKASGATASAEPGKGARKKKDGDATAAKAEKRAEKRAAAAGEKGADGDAAARKKRSADLAAQLHGLENERDLLRSRVKELESELVAMRKEIEAKRAAEAPPK